MDFNTMGNWQKWCYEYERQRAESEKEKSDSYGALRYRLIAQLRALGVEPEA